MTQPNMLKAQQVMTQKYVMLDGMKTVKEGIMELQRAGVDVIMIEKRDEHDAYGIVLLSDIAKRVLAQNRAPERVNLYEIMSKPVVSVPPKMNVRYCARLFESFGLSCAPVIENEEILGVIRYKELVLSQCQKIASE